MRAKPITIGGKPSNVLKILAAKKVSDKVVQAPTITFLKSLGMSEQKIKKLLGTPG